MQDLNKIAFIFPGRLPNSHSSADKSEQADGSEFRRLLRFRTISAACRIDLGEQRGCFCHEGRDIADELRVRKSRNPGLAGHGQGLRVWDRGEGWI